MKEDIAILYEDEHVLAISKPAGLVVHPDGKTAEPSVADWVIENRPEMRDVGEPWTSPEGETIFRPGIVHRLDRDTSGALVLCKTQASFEYMKGKFQAREVEKAYRAFVYGEMKEERGVIDRPIARSRRYFRLWSAQRGARGKEREAVTEYGVIGRAGGFTFVEARPKTGRTHQIRVHFKAINHPIVCDALYAPKREPALGFERLALHSFRIGFEGMDGRAVRVEAPYPADFGNALERFGLTRDS